MTQTAAIPPYCRACGRSIRDPSHIIWNGHHYHNDHIPRGEPPPIFDVAELQPDQDTPGLWIGFKTKEQRDQALNWFRVNP